MIRPRGTTDSNPRPTGDATIVVGDGAVGHEVATRLSAAGESVTCVTTTAPTATPHPAVELW